MSYSTIADLNMSDRRLEELIDSDGTLLQSCQDRATRRINAALEGKYTTPVSPVPAILIQLEADLWKFFIYEHREVMDPPPSVADAYKDAIALLERFRTGQELLDAAHTNAASGPGPAAGSFSSDSDARVFGRAKDGIF